MTTRRKLHFRGFLAIVAIVIVIVVAFIVVAGTYEFAGGSLASFNLLRSSQAFHIAETGLNQAAAAIVDGTATCPNYSSGVVTFTAPTGSGSGQYQVTGSTNIASATLTANISASSSTIPISVVSGTLTSTQGVVTIDNEEILYQSINGNNLINVTRGINGTTAASHTAGVKMTQLECFLTSTAAIPTLSEIRGKRILKMMIAARPTSFGFYINGNYTVPSMVTAGNTTLIGNGTIQDPEVTLASPNYPGANILTTGTVSIQGSSQTLVSNGAGSTITSSSPATTLGDVMQNTSLFDSSSLFSHYFSSSAATVQADSQQYTDAASLNGVQGQAIWFNGDLNVNSTYTIGSPTNPVLLIVNGNFTLNGGATIYGFVYVTGTTSILGTSQLYGGIATAGGAATVQGTAVASLDSNIISLAGSLLGNDTQQKYDRNPITLQESYQ